MNPFAWSGLLTGVSSVSFGLLVFLKSPNRKLAKIWLLFSFAVAVWGFGGMWLGITQDATKAFVILRGTYMFGVLWIASLFHHFVCVFLGAKTNRSIILNYIISFAFIFTVPTSLLFKENYFVYNSMYFGLGGKIFPLFFVWWIGVVIVSHYMMMRKYRDVSEHEKVQIKYFFFAIAFGFTGGSLTYLPNFGISSIYPWGNFAVALYPLIMAYAIVRHRLMEIKVVLKQTLVISLLTSAGVVSYISFVSHFAYRKVAPLANFSILTAILSVGMAIFVASRGTNKKMVRLWTLMCLSVACWCFGFGMMINSANVDTSLFWQKFMYGGAICIPVVFLHFVFLLTNVNYSWELKLTYVAGVVLEFLNFFDFLASVVPRPPFPFYSNALFPGYYLYTAYFFIVVGYAQIILLKALGAEESIRKNQIRYVAVGTLVGFLGGSTTFPLSFGVSIFPIGVYLVVFYMVAVTHAIYKHRLMDINLVLRKSLVYSLMTGILTAAYLVFITQGTQLLQSIFGASTLTTSIIAACIITAGFLPLRDKIQAIADRYFFRDWSERGEMLREVAAGFSHELKSPLAGLSMQAQLTLSELEQIEKNPQSLQEALPRIKEELHYMVNKAMDAARRIEAVRGVAEPSRGEMGPVDVAAVLDNSVGYLKSLIDDVRACVRRNLPENLSPVHSNLKQLEIVFINLMKNALEAMDTNEVESAELSLSGLEENDFVQISIKDTGAGIAAKDLSRIFDPYYSTKGRKGTGMGLFLSSQIVKSHGGSINVESEEGKGTTFIVRLPRYASENRTSGNRAA